MFQLLKWEDLLQIYLFYIFVNLISLGFGLLVGKKTQTFDVLSDSGKPDGHFILFLFLFFCDSSDSSIHLGSNYQING